jgi:hypothetical protein
MKVFLSYRRSDTQDFVGRLADHLRNAPGIAELFLDVDEIAAGEDFEKRIRLGLAECTVSLIVIGRDWRGDVPGGQARIFDEGDFVRMEVREALKSETRVLPVLANGATMPAPETLPADIRRIAALNALSVRHSDFDRDVENLLDAIFARKKPGRLGRFLRLHPALSLALESVAGGVAALLLLTVTLALINVVTPFSLANLTGDNNAAATFFTVLIVLAGAMVPWLIRWRRTLRH